MELLVQDAARGGHPLHLARADGAALAGRIPVRDLALIDDGDGLEAAMGMLAHAARRARRLERMRARIVEQQEGADRRAVAAIREERADRKAVPDPMAAARMFDLCDFLHGFNPPRRGAPPRAWQRY